MVFFQKLLKQAKSGPIFLQKLIIFVTISALIWTVHINLSKWIENMKSEKIVTFQLEQCNCSRTLNISQIEENDDQSIPLISTTCGEDAYHRGPRQKVVTFSFYGDTSSDNHKQKQYFQGISDNLDVLPLFYPSWTIRLYHNVPKGSSQQRHLCSIACNNSQIDLCRIDSLPGTPVVNASNIFPMLWRFFPTLDPQVSVMISRDLDSIFSPREVSAVREWLESSLDLHVMRDHPWHGAPIMGGTWGTKLDRPHIRTNWGKTWTRILNDSIAFVDQSNVGPDQTALQKYVWSWGHTVALQHDSYTCKHFPGSLGFPTERKNETGNFVGAWRYKEPKSIWKICPSKCRRKIEWLYC